MKLTGRDRALLALVSSVVTCFHRLRATGQNIEAVTSWGGGRWSLMHSLAEEGPQTVPMLAHSRPVSRQRIQKLVDELKAEKLVTLKPNPKHKRSKLIALTARGKKDYERMTAQALDMLNLASEGLNVSKLEESGKAIGQIADSLADIEFVEA